ncbi:hypothetical protein NQZ68_032029 [Dissostichus eleginoides]|nr:hypothetical protein NQZ68_032029 [Dissostichus eleginoides]
MDLISERQFFLVKVVIDAEEPSESSNQRAREVISLVRNPGWTAWSTCQVSDVRAHSHVTTLYHTTAAHNCSA